MRKRSRTSYADSSEERLKESRILIEAGAYGGSIYLSDLAAESIIKAFIVGKGEEIKGHNLVQLASDANMTRRLKSGIRVQVDAAIDEANLIWRNLLRYSSYDDLDRMGKEFNIRFEVASKLVRYADLEMDGIKLWAERLYNLASLIVQEGGILWRSQQN